MVNSMETLQDALSILRRHPAVSCVRPPRLVGDGVEVEVTVQVSLPSRFGSAGVTPGGVRAEEPCWLVFPDGWPRLAPKVWLREDFPLNLPHINPHKAGQRVNPCLFDGSLHEVLHRFGLERIVDQLSEWLSKAASGQLIDLQQGWEPTRRDYSPSMVVFSAEDAVVKVPENGTLLLVQGRYFAHERDLIAVASEALDKAPLAFSQECHEAGSLNHLVGNLPFIFARCVDDSATPRVVATYAPETVEDFPSFLENARFLGAKVEELGLFLKRYAQEAFLKGWRQNIFAVVVLLVHRPTQLVGSPGRSVEMLPYVIRFAANEQNPFDPLSEAHPAFHSHRVSPELLSLASGVAFKTKPKLVMLGCGSLGSKVALHLGRAGLGSMIFIDNEAISPHNAARHALVPVRHMPINPSKAVLMKQALWELGHDDCSAFQLDAGELLLDQEAAQELLGDGPAIVLDTTASLCVAAACSLSSALANSPFRRLIQSGMYAGGKVAYLFAEGVKRTVTADDLRAWLFERCRHEPKLRKRLAGDQSDPTRIFVGDNCRSLTTTMTDSKVSRAAALVGAQLEQWLSHEMPIFGQLCVGLEDEHGIGMEWKHEELQPSIVLPPLQEDGWTVRVLASVAQSIDAEAKRWSMSETGGALIGHVSQITRTIIVAGIIDAPADSKRSSSTFVLGVAGLAQALRLANNESLGHLHFIGTWHSHPMGGRHSGIDRETLNRIAEGFQGLPAISLVWTPEDLIVAVEQF